MLCVGREGPESPLAKVLAAHGVPVIKREEVEVLALKDILLLSHDALRRYSEAKTKLEERRGFSDVERIVEEYRRALVRERGSS